MKQRAKVTSPKKSWPAWLWFLSLPTLLLVTGIFLFSYNQRLFDQPSSASDQVHQQNPITPVAKVPADPLQPPYSKKEIHAFWDQHFQKLMQDQIVGGKYGIAEINQRIAELTVLIKERYHSSISVNMMERYLTPVSVGNYALCSSQVSKNGVPEIYISVPALMAATAQVRFSGGPDWPKQMELALIIGYIHELDHLALGFKYADKESTTADELVEEEIVAWAQTCEKTIRVLVENYHFKLSVNDDFYYQQWLLAGRNQQSPAWQQFFWRSYAPFYQKDLAEDQ